MNIIINKKNHNQFPLAKSLINVINFIDIYIILTGTA